MLLYRHLLLLSCLGIRGSTAVFINTAAVIIILIAIVRLGLEVFQFVQLFGTLDYIKDLVNWIEVILYMCAIFFAFVFFTPCNCPLEWQWQMGVVAVFLAWIDFIIFLGKNSLTGTVFVCMTLCDVSLTLTCRGNTMAWNLTLISDDYSIAYYNLAPSSISRFMLNQKMEH